MRDRGDEVRSANDERRMSGNGEGKKEQGRKGMTEDKNPKVEEKPRQPTMLETPVHERPRERLIKVGAGNLSEVELLAIMISRGTKGAPVRQIAERLRQTVASTVFTTTSGPIQVTISLGVAIAEPTLTTVEELIWRADQALYSAKCMGRNRVSVWGENNFA